LIVFKLTALGIGSKGSGPSYGYVSLFDGVKLGTSSKKFASPDRAIEGLDKELNCAIKILERGPKFDSQGKKIGERVVAIIGSPISREPGAVVMWTDRSVLCRIQSTSLHHVLRFERTEAFP
jgi:hypothetical protein